MNDEEMRRIISSYPGGEVGVKDRIIGHMSRGESPAAVSEQWVLLQVCGPGTLKNDEVSRALAVLVADERLILEQGLYRFRYPLREIII